MLRVWCWGHAISKSGHGGNSWLVHSTILPIFHEVFVQYVTMTDILKMKDCKQETLEFCNCTPNQVWLICMGYIGGFPLHPQIAFWICLFLITSCYVEVLHFLNTRVCTGFEWVSRCKKPAHVSKRYPTGKWDGRWSRNPPEITSPDPFDCSLKGGRKHCLWLVMLLDTCYKWRKNFL